MPATSTKASSLSEPLEDDVHGRVRDDVRDVGLGQVPVDEPVVLDVRAEGLGGFGAPEVHAREELRGVDDSSGVTVRGGHEAIVGRATDNGREVMLMGVGGGRTGRPEHRRRARPEDCTGSAWACSGAGVGSARADPGTGIEPARTAFGTGIEPARTAFGTGIEPARTTPGTGIEPGPDRFRHGCRVGVGLFRCRCRLRESRPGTGIQPARGLAQVSASSPPGSAQAPVSKPARASPATGIHPAPPTPRTAIHPHSTPQPTPTPGGICAPGQPLEGIVESSTTWRVNDHAVRDLQCRGCHAGPDHRTDADRAGAHQGHGRHRAEGRGGRARRLRDRGAPQPAVRTVVAHHDARLHRGADGEADPLHLHHAHHHQRPGEDRGGLRDAPAPRRRPRGPDDGPRQHRPGVPVVRPGHPSGHQPRHRELRPAAPPVARGRRGLGGHVPLAAPGLHLDTASAGRRTAVRLARFDPQPRDRRAGGLLRRRVLPQQHLLV